MKAKETASNSQNVATDRHAPTFAKVLDGRKQPIRGLWIRGERYYAQLKIENQITGVKKTKRVPLVDKDGNAVQTAAAAVAELRRLQTQRADNTLPTLARQPKFADYAKKYLEIAKLGKPGEEPKKPSTVEKEKAILGRWENTIGQLRLDQIKRVHVNRFIEKRLREEVSARTINLDVIGLRVLLKQALSDGLIQRLPTEGLRPMKVSTEKRPLFSASDLEKLCEAALKKGVTKNGDQLVEYLTFMAYSGCRRNEALGMQWGDVDLKAGLLHIRRQITNRKINGGIEALKNREERTLDINPKLKAHLVAMKERAQGVSKWLFPSPQRGDKDIPSKSFRESMELAKKAASMPHVGFHDMRHHFISMCVMSGIDYMTIAAWVGHKDGGILIGKVYGHLANEHRRAMAEKVNFGPVVVATAINQ
jgi:integrase